MKPSDYLVDATVLQINVVTAAHDDIGEGEDLDANGRGTNRSAYVDAVNARFGSPPGSYWCGNAVGKWTQDGGGKIPATPGEADAWRRMALEDATFVSIPEPGDAVLYGTAAHVDHIGIVARVVPDPTVLGHRRVLTIEGNTSIGSYNRDGWVVAEKSVNREKLVGYVRLTPAEGVV